MALDSSVRTAALVFANALLDSRNGHCMPHEPTADTIRYGGLSDWELCKYIASWAKYAELPPRTMRRSKRKLRSSTPETHWIF